LRIIAGAIILKILQIPVVGLDCALDDLISAIPGKFSANEYLNAASGDPRKTDERLSSARTTGRDKRVNAAD
jgi:hypothetical protein